MKTKSIIGYSLLNAVLSVAYIALVATFMTNAEALPGPVKGVLVAMMFLLVFVISASVMGILVFGRPVVWYLDGLKREAITLAISTVGFLALIAVIVFITLVLNAEPPSINPDMIN